MADFSLWTLNALHEQNNATMLADYRGEIRACEFSGWTDEVHAFRASSVVFDLSDRSQFRLTGDDRVQFLNGFCTNDIKKLSVGQGCEAFITSIKSRALGHVFISRRENDLWVDSASRTEDSLIAHLDRYLITDDVELTPETANYGTLLVAGAKVEDCLESFEGSGVNEKLLNAHDHITVHGEFGSVIMRRVNWLSQPGYLLGVERHQLETVWNVLVEKGVVPAGWKVLETLRIQNKFPEYGRDITDDNLVQEVGRDKLAISFEKGCYLGQEPIARLDAMGHVNRLLCKMKISASEETELKNFVGMKLFAEGKEQGRITSIAMSQEGEHLIAIGYLRSACAKVGTCLTDHENGSGGLVVEVV